MFQLLKVQILAVLNNSPCVGQGHTIKHGVPNVAAELMAEQIIQELASKWGSLPYNSQRANIEKKVEEWKTHANEVIVYEFSLLRVCFA